MNDQLQQALAAILNQSMSALQAGVTFLQAELPDVIRQLLLWHAVRSGVYAVAWLIVLVLAVKWSIRAWKHKNTIASHEDGYFGYGLLAVLLGVLAIGAVIDVMQHSMTTLQILIAPKLYLIEYAASLVKK